MNNQHTPGPWHIAGEGADYGIYSGAQTDQGGWVNSLQVLPFFDTDLKHGLHGTRHLADARLIAAAPDLLAACRNAERELDSAIRNRILGETWTSLQVALADAIAKAEGREAGETNPK